jgi:hypothetical protein
MGNIQKRKKWKITAVASPSLSAIRNSRAERKLRIATNALSIVSPYFYFSRILPE